MRSLPAFRVAGPALGWRWPFVIVSVPSCLVAGVMLWVCREPARGGTEAALREQFEVGGGPPWVTLVAWAHVRRMCCSQHVLLAPLLPCPKAVLLPWTGPTSAPLAGALAV